MNGWGQFALGAVVAMVLAAIMTAAGRRIRRGLGLATPAGVAFTVDLLVGSWLLGGLVLALGLAGLLRPPALAVAVVLVASLGDWRGWRRALRPVRLLALAALPLVVVAGAPPFFYDAWVYHLGLPWQALQEGAIVAHPENVFSAFPPLAQLVYAVPLALGVLRAPALIHLIFYVAGAQAVSCLARRLGAVRAVAILAGIAVIYLPTSTLVPGLPAAEGWALAGLAAAAVVGLTGRPGRGGAVLAGLVAGIALAARLQGLPWCALIVCVVWLRAPRDFAAPLWTAAAVADGAAPWWVKNALLLGQPWAPVGWHREGLETLWRDAGSTVFRAGGWWAALPGIYGTLVGMAWLLAPLLACGLAAYFLRRRVSVLLAVGLATAGAFLWAGTGSLPRFMVPTLALGIAAAAAVPRRLAALAVVLFVALGGFGLVRTWNSLVDLGGMSALGDDAVVYAAPQLTRLVGNPYPGYRAAAALPEDARVLLVCEPRGFLLPRPFIAPSQHDPSPLREVLEQTADPQGARAELRRRGFSHLLVNTHEWERLGPTYPVLPWRGPEGHHRAAAFLRGLGEPVIDEAPVKIWALEGGG